MIVISGFLTAIKCLQHYASTDFLAGLRGLYTSKGEGGRRRRVQGEMEVKGRKREGPLPLTQITGSGPWLCYVVFRPGKHGRSHLFRRRHHRPVHSSYYSYVVSEHFDHSAVLGRRRHRTKRRKHLLSPNDW